MTACKVIAIQDTTSIVRQWTSCKPIEYIRKVLNLILIVPWHSIVSNNIHYHQRAHHTLKAALLGISCRSHFTLPSARLQTLEPVANPANRPPFSFRASDQMARCKSSPCSRSHSRSSCCSAPVSYTHLDVYKRQLMVWYGRGCLCFVVYTTQCEATEIWLLITTVLAGFLSFRLLIQLRKLC